MQSDPRATYRIGHATHPGHRMTRDPNAHKAVLLTVAGGTRDRRQNSSRTIRMNIDKGFQGEAGGRTPCNTALADEPLHTHTVAGKQARPFIDYHNFIFAADQHIALYLPTRPKASPRGSYSFIFRDTPAPRLPDNGHWDSTTDTRWTISVTPSRCRTFYP